MSKSRKFVDAIVKQINKSPAFNNASSAIGNATERAQIKFLSVQNIATEKYKTIAKQVNGATIIQDVNAANALPTVSPLPQRLVDWWQWYQQLTGLDTVEVAKSQVILVQDQLFKCQNERRTLTHQSHAITEKLKEIYGELIQTRRDDPKYVQLTIMENKGLQEQTRLTGQLNLLEHAERDHFTQLATAIKEYHDAQAINAQKYKYLSILASAFIAIMSLTGSMIYNNRRIADVRRVISEAQKNNEAIFRESFQSLEKKTDSSFSTIIGLFQTKVVGGETSAVESKIGSSYTIDKSRSNTEWQQPVGIILGISIVLALLVLGNSS